MNTSMRCSVANSAHQLRLATRTKSKMTRLLNLVLAISDSSGIQAVQPLRNLVPGLPLLLKASAITVTRELMLLKTYLTKVTIPVHQWH